MTSCATRSRCGWRSARCIGQQQLTESVRRPPSEYHTEALAQAREQAKESAKDGDEYAAAALEFAVAYHRAALTWLKSAPRD